MTTMSLRLSVRARHRLTYTRNVFPLESGWITAQMLTVDGGRMDYIGHG